MQGDFFGRSAPRRKPSGAAARDKPGEAKIAIRVTQSGEVAVSGLGRFPVTLHKDQWQRLLDMSGEIRAFIAAHEGELLPKR